MQFFSISDRGKLRKSNEDCCLAREIGSYTLLILADGMGGHKGGEIASLTAIESISKLLAEKLTDKMLPGQIMLLLSEVLEKVNGEILEMSKTDLSLIGMGTTCDICVISKNTAYIAHVGDSRVYKISKSGNILRLTKDHSLVQYMLESGTITAEEAVHHPQKNIILRALGSSPQLEPDIFHEKMSAGDVILMCSDGLSNMLDEELIRKTVSEDATPEGSAEKLVQLANDAGGADNITVIIAKL